VEIGPNPEIEMRSRLKRVGFEHTPRLLAAFRGTLDNARPEIRVWLGILQGYVPNDGEGWSHAVDAARRYLGRARRRSTLPGSVESIIPMSPWESAIDPIVAELTRDYERMVERLGGRTAELHTALATATEDPAFAAQPPSILSRRSAYQRMRTLTASVFDTLLRRVAELDPEERKAAESVLGRRADALAVFYRLLERPLTSPRIRCHGNLHLGQFLHAGRELVIIDFDGEPGRPLYERRLKLSPLQDVATMVRSFHYAAHAAVREARPRAAGRVVDAERDWRWMRAWQLRMGAVFIDAYSRGAAASGLLPADPDEARLLFQTYVLERAIYELGYELNHRRAWIMAPLLDLPFLLTASDGVQPGAASVAVAPT
jgi:maltose alpha-D-glucosyltransferase/alpha-amylase